MSQTERGKRLSIDLRPGQKEELENLINWGTQRDIFVPLVDLLIEAIKTNGLGQVMEGLSRGKLCITAKSETVGGLVVRPW